MELQKRSIRRYYRNKMAVVDAVSGLLPYLELDSRLIMTIKQVRSGDFSVCFVTDLSSGDTVDPLAKNYFDKQQTT